MPVGIRQFSLKWIRRVPLKDPPISDKVGKLEVESTGVSQPGWEDYCFTSRSEKCNGT